jgi:hypothetical protein
MEAGNGYPCQYANTASASDTTTTDAGVIHGGTTYAYAVASPKRGADAQ